jgi:hypothetical protein
MSCCAVGTCTDPDCELCQRVARLPQPGTRESIREKAKATRDGDAKRKGGENLAFKKRHRVGPGR